MARDRDDEQAGLDGESVEAGRFSVELMHAAATRYYVQDQNQADVARELGVSRATVSRLLSEARRLGIVRIEIVNPTSIPRPNIEEELAAALGLSRALVAPATHSAVAGASLAPLVSEALDSVPFTRGDVLLLSSGRTVWEVSQHRLPTLRETRVAPTVGGHDEPEAWYQTNEITRTVAQRISGHPVFLYAPAQPGPALYKNLLNDPGAQRVFKLWEEASCAIVGVGAPPRIRQSMPGFVPRDAPGLQKATGDICTRFFDEHGQEIAYPGSDRLIATTHAQLRAVPATIAVAIGVSKVPSILAGARAGWFTTLVTDGPTAAALIEEVTGERV